MWRLLIRRAWQSDCVLLLHEIQVYFHFLFLVDAMGAKFQQHLHKEECDTKAIIYSLGHTFQWEANIFVS